MVSFWPLANVATFGVNTYLTFAVGAVPSSADNAAKRLLCPGGKSNSEISSLYPTLVTPSGWAFSIWGLIFLSEGASVAWQMFAPEDVQVAMAPAAPFLCSAFLLQGTWTVAFARDQIALSSGLLAGIAGCMGAAYYLLQPARELHEEARTYGLTTPSTATFSERWLGFGSRTCGALCRFPFSLHLAWLSVATMVNANMWLVKAGLSPRLQQRAASATKWTAALGAVVATVMFRDPTFAFVASWALKAISSFRPKTADAEGDAAARAGHDFLTNVDDAARARQSRQASRLSTVAVCSAGLVLAYRFAMRYTWAS